MKVSLPPLSSLLKFPTDFVSNQSQTTNIIRIKKQVLFWRVILTRWQAGLVNNAKQFGRPRSFSLSNVFREKAGLSNRHSPFPLCNKLPWKSPTFISVRFPSYLGRFPFNQRLSGHLRKGNKYRIFLSQPGSGWLICLTKWNENTIQYWTMQTLRIEITLSHLRALHDALRETFLKVTKNKMLTCWTSPKPALGTHWFQINVSCFE